MNISKLEVCTLISLCFGNVSFGSLQMEDYPELTNIINCFTSLDQLLAFARWSGTENDPYVQQRASYIRSLEENNSMKCIYCGAVFKILQRFYDHMAMHQAINDFDLSLLDNNPSAAKKQCLEVPDENTGFGPFDGNAEAVAGPSHQYGGGNDNGSSGFTIRLKREKTYAKNGAIDKTFEVKFPDQLQNKKLSDIMDDLHELFDDVLDRVRQGAQENSLARVIIEHNDLTDPIVVPLQELNKIDASTVTDEISKVLQSNENLSMNEGSCSIAVGCINLPSGGAVKVRITNLTGENNSLMRKRSVTLCQVKLFVCPCQ